MRRFVGKLMVWRVWIGLARLHRGVAVGFAIYPHKWQAQVFLVWPHYLPIIHFNVSTRDS